MPDEARVGMMTYMRILLTNFPHLRRVMSKGNHREQHCPKGKRGGISKMWHLLDLKLYRRLSLCEAVAVPLPSHDRS